MPAIIEVDYYNSFWLKKIVNCAADIDPDEVGGPVSNPGIPIFPGIFPLATTIPAFPLFPNYASWDDTAAGTYGPFNMAERLDWQIEEVCARLCGPCRRP